MWHAATHAVNWKSGVAPHRNRVDRGVALRHIRDMSKTPTFVSAREALALFMARQTPRLDDAAMAALVKVSRTGITKIRSGERDPSLQLASSLEAVTGIPASAWQPASPEQGRVSPSWLKTPPPAPAKAKAKTRRTSAPAVA